MPSVGEHSSSARNVKKTSFIMNLLFFLTKASPSHQERGSHDDGRSRRPPPGQADAALPAREQQPGDFSCAVKMQGKPSSFANFDDFALTCSSFENVDSKHFNFFILLIWR